MSLSKKRTLAVGVVLLILAGILYLRSSSTTDTPVQRGDRDEGGASVVGPDHPRKSPGALKNAGPERHAEGPEVVREEPAQPSGDPSSCFGRVVDDEEKPIPGATVFLLICRNNDWERLILPHAHNGAAVGFLRKVSHQRTTTDGDGAYRFDLPALEEGGWFIVVACSADGALNSTGRFLPHLGEQTRLADLVLGEKRRTIMGSVVGENGLPIVGAKVRVFCDEYASDGEYAMTASIYFPSSFCGTEVLTDGAGRYRIDFVGDGDEVIEVVADGCSSVRQTIPEQRDRESSTEVNFVLESGGTISGKVVDDTGRPLRAAVAAVIHGIGNDRYRVTCDANGGYRLEGVPRTSVRLVAGHEGYAVADRVLDVTADLALDFSLKPLPKIVISGKVIDRASGLPIADIRVFDAGNQLRTTTEEDGTFVLTGHHATDGDVILEVMHHRGYQMNDVVRIALEGRSTVDGIVIGLERRTTLNVDAVDGATGRSLALDARITVMTEDRSTTVTGDDVPPGTYVIQSTLWGYYPAETRVTAVKGERNSVRIEMRRRGEGRVRGRLLNADGQPARSRTIYLMPEEGRMTGDGGAFTNTEGAFEKAFPEGIYRLILDDGRDFAETVNIREGEVTSIELHVPPSEPVEEERFTETPRRGVDVLGSVTINGAPCAGTIKIEYPRSSSVNTFTLGPVTDGGIPLLAGHFSTRLRPGGYRCVVMKAKRPIAEFPFDVPDGVTNATFEFRLEGFRVAGVAANSAGVAVPLASIEWVPTEEEAPSLTATTDSMGRYALDAVPAGKYWVVMKDIEIGYAAVVERTYDAATDDDRMTIRRAGRVKISFVGRNGVLPWVTEADAFTALAYRHFSDSFLPPGTYAFEAGTEGFRSKRVTFTIEEGKETLLDVVLDPE